MPQLAIADPRRFFERYRDDGRARPIDGFVLEVLPHYSRLTAEFPETGGMVMFADLPEALVAPAIAAEIAHFAAAGQAFEWKVHAFDRPADLRERLQAAGLVAGNSEMLLVAEAAMREEIAPPPGVSLRQLASDGEIAAVVALQEAVWGEPLTFLSRRLARGIAGIADPMIVFGAYEGERMIGEGYVEFPRGSAFAELHGGAVLPAHRGRGIYRALLQVRMNEAARRGAEMVVADATADSQPRLERAGFRAICRTWPMRMERRA